MCAATATSSHFSVNLVPDSKRFDSWRILTKEECEARCIKLNGYFVDSFGELRPVATGNIRFKIKCFCSQTKEFNALVRLRYGRFKQYESYAKLLVSCGMSTRNKFGRITFKTAEEYAALQKASHSKEEDGPLIVFSFVVLTKWVQPTQSLEKEHALFKSYLNRCLPSSLVLDSREKGVAYPVIHLCNDREILASSLTAETSLENQFILRQGVYREIRSIKLENDYDSSEYYQPQHTAYLILGFKSLENRFNQVMIDSWKDWTGALYIYMNLPEEFGLSRIRFFLREAPNSLNLFTYIVLVECHNIIDSEREMLLLDFVRKMRVEKMAGFISLYKASPSS